MATPRTRLTDAEWNQHKPYIRRMIIEQNMCQEEARQRLKDDGVLLTKAQLEYKLKIWGFRKKAPKEKSDVIWQFIGHRVEKRKQQQKASDVLLNGQLVDPTKVRKEINRHQPTSLVKIKQVGMSPKTPESMEVIIRTPASTSMQYLWPTCLPWLQFQRSISLSFAVLQPTAVMDHLSMNSVTKKKPTFLYSLSQVIGNSTINNVSSLATGLDIFMPETCQDENQGRAQLLLRGSAKDILIEDLNLVFYQLSNKLGDLHKNTGQWLSVVSLLEKSGVMQMAFHLGKMTDTTLLSVTETLFQEAFNRLWDECRYNFWHKGFIKEKNSDSELETYESGYGGAYIGWDRDWDKVWDAGMLTKLPSWKIINWLLACGQNPNTPIPFKEVGEEERRLAPLQVAADIACPHLIFLLLGAKSDPTLFFDEPQLFIEIFLRRGKSNADKLRLLKRLLEYPACVGLFEGKQRAPLLAAAVAGLDSFYDRESDLLDFLIGNETESCAKHRTSARIGWITQTCSVLGHAILRHDESVARRCFLHLLGRFWQNSSLVPAQFVTPDVVLLAAFLGHNRILGLLQELNVDFTLCGYRGITALHVAACNGHLETCQRLLELGVPVDGYPGSQHLPSPLHIAASKGDIEIIQLFHSHGADLTRSITLDEHRIWGDIIYEMKREGADSPAGAVLVGYDLQAFEFFAQQRVKFPPWAAYQEVSRHTPRPPVLRSVLRSGADPNWTGKGGLTALQISLQQKTLGGEADVIEIAMTLLDAGAVLTGGEITKAILLRLDDHTLVYRLLEVDHLGIGQAHESISALEAAIANGRQDLITPILTRYPGTYDSGALCSSVLFEDHGLRTVNHLLNNRPQLQRVLPLESLAIGIAASRDDGDLLDLLLATFRKPSAAILPINLAVFRRSDFLECPNQAIEQAKSRGELFWRDDDQILVSPLVLALMSKRSLSRLLDHGFRPDRLTMSIAAMSGDDGLIRKLSGYPMLSRGPEGYEGPLSVAVSRNDIDAVKSLLDGNCCINEDNSLVKGGRSPLQMAVERGYLDLIKLLLYAGADVNTSAARLGGATALQLAAIKGYLGVAKMLVDHGADLNASSALYHGRTALEGAAENGRIDTIQYLLSEGVETNGKGRLSYLRAIRYAEIEVHVVAVNLLKTWRGWTADDDALWDELKSLSKDECEQFNEEDSEDQLDSETEPERASSGKINEGDRTQDLVLHDAPTGAARMHVISVTASAGNGIVSELEDLEMMTSDTFNFWSEL